MRTAGVSCLPQAHCRPGQLAVSHIHSHTRIFFYRRSLPRSVKFNLEGERGRKAQVWAEVRKGSYDFRYLVVLAKDRSRVWSVVDLRRPEPTEEERQARVTSALQDAKWAFYVDADVDVKSQAAQLGEYWLKVKCVRCDDNPAACEEAGVASRPAWKTNKGDVIKGVMSVRELEKAAHDEIFKKKSWWPF